MNHDQSDLTKRVQWTVLATALRAFAAIAAGQVAAVIWRRVYGEEPPE